MEIKLPDITVPEGTMAFVQRILGPLAEAGDFLSDKIRFYRWKSSLSVMQKAQSIARQRGVSPQEIPLKVLVPLLEKASLEEEGSPLLDRWAHLLAQSAADPTSVEASYVDILARLTSEDVQALEWIVPEELVESGKKGNKELDFDTRMTIELNVREFGYYGDFNRAHEILADIDNDSYRDEVSKICDEIMGMGDGVFCENITLDPPRRLDDLGPGSIYRHTNKLDKLSSADILVASGLVVRRSFTLSLPKYVGTMTLISPTILGIRFVMACRGKATTASAS